MPKHDPAAVQGELGGPGTGQQEPHAVAIPADRPGIVRVAAGDDLNDLMRVALEQGGEKGVAALEKLVDLRIKLEDRSAAKAHAEAMAAFKADLATDPIIKDMSTEQGKEEGSKFTSTWASLARIAKHIDPKLAKVGLSYTWSYRLDGPNLLTTCRNKHVLGHFEETTATIPTESRAGMSPQQKISSAQAYGDRLSLIGVYGLTTVNSDKPGQVPVDPTPIAKEVADELMKSLGANSVSLTAFLKAMHVDTIVAIPAARLEEAKLMIRQAIEARKAREAGKA